MIWLEGWGSRCLGVMCFRGLLAGFPEFCGGCGLCQFWAFSDRALWGWYNIGGLEFGVCLLGDLIWLEGWDFRCLGVMRFRRLFAGFPGFWWVWL